MIISSVIIGSQLTTISTFDSDYADFLCVGNKDVQQMRINIVDIENEQGIIISCLMWPSILAIILSISGAGIIIWNELRKPKEFEYKNLDFP